MYPAKSTEIQVWYWKEEEETNERSARRQVEVEERDRAHLNNGQLEIRGESCKTSRGDVLSIQVVQLRKRKGRKRRVDEG